MASRHVRWRWPRLGLISATILVGLLFLLSSSNTDSKTSPRGDIAHGFPISRIHQHLYKHNKRANVQPASNDDYEKAATKGQLLMCWMKDPSMAGSQATSKWKDNIAIEDYGWTEATIGNSLGETSPGLKDLVPSSYDLTKADKAVIFKHDKAVKSKPDYPATLAEYKNNMYPESGVIVADWNWGPNVMIRDGLTSKGSDWDPAVDKKPELNQLSDFWWLGWKKYTTAEQLPKLRHIVQHNVVNVPTQRVLASVLQKHWPEEEYPKQGKAPAWPGKEITPDMEGFAALLGINSVWGIPWMLIQHHDELGKLEVKKITAYTENLSPYFYQPNLIVELGEVTE